MVTSTDHCSSLVGQAAGRVPAAQELRGPAAAVPRSQRQVPSSARAEHAQGGVAVREHVGPTGCPGAWPALHRQVSRSVWVPSSLTGHVIVMLT